MLAYEENNFNVMFGNANLYAGNKKLMPGKYSEHVMLRRSNIEREKSVSTFKNSTFHSHIQEYLPGKSSKVDLRILALH